MVGTFISEIRHQLNTVPNCDCVWAPSIDVINTESTSPRWAVVLISFSKQVCLSSVMVEADPYFNEGERLYITCISHWMLGIFAVAAAPRLLFNWLSTDQKVGGDWALAACCSVLGQHTEPLNCCWWLLHWCVNVRGNISAWNYRGGTLDGKHCIADDEQVST